MTENEARRVVLLQVREGAETPLWTHDDRAWASRLAAQTAGEGAGFEDWLLDRTRHAMERLLPRDAAGRRWLERRAWRPQAVLWVVALGLVIGAAVDHFGGRQRIDLLAPPVWGLVAWNLAVYSLLALPGPAWLHKWVARRWTWGGDGAARAWAPLAMPLALQRAALLMHIGAAALAAGVAGGMYLRGLVLDFRAGWQSTFLDAGVVQSTLDVLLAPASALTAVRVPEVAPLRITAEAAATGDAAPWIHLYAATLALFIVVPRLALALAAGWRSWRLARRFPLPLAGPYFDRLRLQRRRGKVVVQVLAHGESPAPQAALGLRRVLAQALGDEPELRFEPVTAYGDEDGAYGIEPGDATLRIALVDLSATPEPEAQGRFLDAAAGQLPLVVVADEAGFARRFAATPERLSGRRAAWKRLAESHRAGFVSIDLAAPGEAAARALEQALLA